MPPTPPIAGAASPQTPMTQALSQGLQPPGAQQDAASGQMEALMGQIREIGQLVQAVEQDFPTVAPDMQQIQQILKKSVVTLANAASAQTASGMAVPMGQGGV